jgi:hypothetical protein
MKQFLITPAAGKKLIAMALATHPAIINAIKYHTLVVVAGTTNGYVAEEILNSIGQCDDFSKLKFFRGIVIPPSIPQTSTGRFYDDSEFIGDVVIEKGVWKKGKTIYDVVDELDEEDIILKGANSVDLINKKAAIYIGHPKAGTIGVALQAIVGRCVGLIIPVGLEKRVPGNLDEIAIQLNKDSDGPRLLPVPGEIFTEIEAIKILCNLDAILVAGGGVGGAEGSVWLGINGDNESMQKAENILSSVSSEKPFEY